MRKVESPAGWGVQTGPEIRVQGYWTRLVFEAVLWRDLQSLLTLRFFAWSIRDNEEEPMNALTLFRIQFLMLDLELYILGGKE